VLVAPEIVTSFGVYNGQVGVSRGRLPVVFRHSIFRYVAALNAPGLATSKDDVATFIGVCGQQENQVSLLSLYHDLKLFARC